MAYNNDNDYQYNSCTSRGICSVDPRTSSLQQILVLYLRLTAHYILQMKEDKPAIRSLILNTISIMVSNPEFSENDFKIITSEFNRELPQIIREYEVLCKENNQKPDYIKTTLKYNRKTDIIKSIQQGEKEFLKAQQSIPVEVQNAYTILFVLAKSLCTNILDLESFEINEDYGYKRILESLNLLNRDISDISELKEFITETAKINNNLMKRLRQEQIKRYGRQFENEVSHTTTAGKAILVVGSNIRELENILESVKECNIDVYTHDDMILAHTFPKFSEYKNLKGQFGKGMENCLLDFATFPGPIILTRHSLYNVEHLYRGQLYTTDFAYSKGVIPIINNDFSQVIEAAQNSRGFKSGKVCESEDIGFDYIETFGLIKKKIDSGKYKRIFIISHGGYTSETENYSEKLIEKTPEDVLIISLSLFSKRENVVCLNAGFDTLASAQLADDIEKNTELPITIFFPVCDRHTISKMIYHSSGKGVNVFVGSCTPIMLNPNLIKTLTNIFGIQEFTTVKNDLEKIINNEI